MKDSKIYGSMIISILSSSKHKQSALQAVHDNFKFLGTLGLEINQLLENSEVNCKGISMEIIDLVDQFTKNCYPYLGGIALKPSRRKEYHSS